LSFTNGGFVGWDSKNDVRDAQIVKMWLLENLEDVFGGKRMWLRPGKLYLFGRTVSEPGQVAISDKTISRKHLTIKVDEAAEGSGRNVLGRSKLTIEDLNTKMGTLVNDQQIRGTQHVVAGDDNTVKLGLCTKLFRLFWHPVVLSFSFTSKELALDPWVKLRAHLEQLDIKYLADYDMQWTSHVVTKKRNTSKGLRALINGRYIVADTFIKAIAAAASADAAQKSALELDYDENWPDALQHLPPRGEEPGNRPIESYGPDERRAEIFDGYTFVFYERKQYDNLFNVIANGKGKVLVKEAVAHETQVEDFVQYVKNVAGEKGMGSCEDGSEGRGVVVVRYAPSKGPDIDWFTDFTESTQQRLDHRFIEQNEFLDAILACDASILRRPIETAGPTVQTNRRGSAEAASTEIDPPSNRAAPEATVADPDVTLDEPDPVAPVRPRRVAKSRFKGFDVDDDDEKPPSKVPEASGAQDESNNLLRKRAASVSLEEADPVRLMDEIAPAATAAKRRRIAAGEDPIPRRSPLPVAEEAEIGVQETTPAKGRGRGAKAAKAAAANKDEIREKLEMARKLREEKEAKRKAEEEAAAERDEGEIDWTAIRKLQIVEDMKIREPRRPVAERSREQDIAEGRWDPKWNGRRNFKRFRRQGEQPGRPTARVIVGLEEVKTKAYGLGDEYWLEDQSADKNMRRDSQRHSHAQASVSQEAVSISQNPSSSAKGKQPASKPVVLDDSFSSDDDENTSPSIDRDSHGTQTENEPPRTKAGKAAEKANARRGQTQSQLASTQTRTQTHARSTRATQKRAAAETPPGNTTKRPRREIIELGDSGGDSDDDGGTKFKFGRR
jgi:hypothetical protein